ncbi:hypothetical protein F66182_8548 [Fusarium sp. NRRL 66182]|nr:hypothetical protein F66182_8548 [Fusarium sp. NRRL 66182]
MVTSYGASTPPPPSRIRTPPTPRLGSYQDNWEPFSPRKSARISSQRTRTPSPGASKRQPQSPRTTKKSNQHLNDAAIASPMPHKKRMPALDSVRRAAGNMEGEGESSRDGANRRPSQRSRSSVAGAAGMLPTPSKTPQKPPSEKKKAQMESVARNLFNSNADEAISTPKKRGPKKYTGISMESFAAEEIEDPINIFTDSRDRIPARDENEENPFLVSNKPSHSEASKAESTKRHDKRKVRVPGEGTKTIDELVNREDGMPFMFRGKRYYRKWAEQEIEDLEEIEVAKEDPEAYLHRPLSRSSIKPKRLFQAVKTVEQIEEEEAVTDVEENDEAENEAQLSCPATPSVSKKEHVSTPEAPRFAPASPPSTRRVTRSAHKLADEDTPAKPPGKRSPFDSWRRTKEPHPKSPSRKRSGESLDSRESKRTRI